ncbi:MAG: T9SS type A sorting domain-containing protein, partial [Chitinophagaceae bacterium]|nr:T9SS type A sorting domain-containing protein [Chitinophagaceae bacterium]
TLQGWASDPSTPSNLILGANGIHYGTNALSDRNYLVNGKFWTINGDTLDNAFCCIPTNETLLETACNSYFFNGQTLTSNGTYTANFINAAGCDSIVTIYLTLNQSSSSTIIQSVCNSYVFNGQTLTSSGTYVDTLSNAVDCDSIVTLILTILHNSTAISQTACNSYFFNGQTLTSSGTYTDTLVNTAGCDSLITLNLTITQVNTSTSQSGFVISSNANGATYQWVKCPSYSIIPNETSQTYTAAANGSFAVIVTQNGCTDTSNCVTVTGVGINEHEMDQTIYVYPNPTNGIFTIQKQDPFNGPSSIRILDVTGQVIYTSNFNRPTTQYTINISNQPAGIYLVELKQDEEIARVKVVKE